MAHAEVHRRGVVGRDEGSVDAGEVAVDEDDGQAPVAQGGVAARVGVGDRVDPGDEDDPGDPAVEERADVVVLVNGVEGLGAEHGGVALAGQRGLDHLGEEGEPGVGQLRHHEADEAGR